MTMKTLMLVTIALIGTVLAPGKPVAAETATGLIGLPLSRPAGRIRTAVVIPFSDRSGLAAPHLARYATDAVAVELANSGAYDVLRTKIVEEGGRDLNLRPPYDKADMERLAKSLGADVVVTGEIVFVRREKTKDSTRVRVGLKVRVMDPDTGELISCSSTIATQEVPNRRP